MPRRKPQPRKPARKRKAAAAPAPVAPAPVAPAPVDASPLGADHSSSSAVTSLTEKVDRDLARLALQKMNAGKVPSAQERQALKRVESAKEEKDRWRFYRSIPQKHWREMSGRQAKILIEQAERYGIPFGAAEVDLPKVVRSLHDFLAANSRKLAIPDEDQELFGGASSPALERLRAARASLAEMEVEKQQGILIERETLEWALAAFAAVLRKAADTLTRQYGNEAGRILIEAVDEAEHGWEKSVRSNLQPRSGEDGEARSGEETTSTGEAGQAQPSQPVPLGKGATV